MHKRGFTLIELMVAVTIFAIIMVMSMGAVLSIIEANKKSRSLKSAMNNLNLVVETIARNIKFGTNWKCGNPPVTCDDSEYEQIEFTDSFSISGTSQQVSYRLNEAGIERKIGLGNFEAVTSPEILIEVFKFNVSGVGLDDKQPFLRIKVGGVAGTKASNQTRFDLQTAISQRDIEDVEFP